jgi:hypothetical protein
VNESSLPFSCHCARHKLHLDIVSDARCAVHDQRGSSPRLIVGEKRLFVRLPLEPEVVPIRPVALETAGLSQLRVGFDLNREINPLTQLAARARDALEYKDWRGLQADRAAAMMRQPCVGCPKHSLTSFERLEDMLGQQRPPIKKAVMPRDVIGVNAFSRELRS